MKKQFIFLLAAATALSAQAIDSPFNTSIDVASPYSKHVSGPFNVIKTNLLSYVAYNVNVSYEFKFANKFSVGITGGIKLPQTIPLDLEGTSSSEGDFTWDGDVTVKGIIISPYSRMYFKEAMTGGYLELWTRYYNYELEIPFEYDKDGQIIDDLAIGTTKAFGAGLAFGTQVQLGKIFVLDFFGGLGMGIGTIHLETRDESPLDAQDYADIKEEMAEISDVEFGVLQGTIDKVTYDASPTKAWADAEKIALPMLKAGISFGIMF